MAQGVDLCLILQWNPLLLAAELGGERVHRGSMNGCGGTVIGDSLFHRSNNYSGLGLRGCGLSPQ